MLRKNDPINLICFPYAGGNRYSYKKYEEALPDFINLVPVELPGRGARSGEALISSLELAIEDICSQINRQILANYAIYGHSLGGLIAYLFTHKILEQGLPPPKHIFITGTTGPSAMSRAGKKRSMLSKVEFIQELKDLDGFPEDLLANEELLDYLEPILRSDFKVSEDFTYKEAIPLDVPFTVITGRQERMAISDIHLWQKESLRHVNFKQMPGGHFFINDFSLHIVSVFAKTLFPYI